MDKRLSEEVYKDQPIQWHLTNSTQDVCPKCGEQDMDYFNQKDRTCNQCGATFNLKCSVEQWLKNIGE